MVLTSYYRHLIQPPLYLFIHHSFFHQNIMPIMMVVRNHIPSFKNSILLIICTNWIFVLSFLISTWSTFLKRKIGLILSKINITCDICTLSTIFWRLMMENTEEEESPIFFSVICFYHSLLCSFLRCFTIQCLGWFGIIYVDFIKVNWFDHRLNQFLK